MASHSLLLPPADFSAFRHEVTRIDPARLLRISRYNVNEPFFGASGANRFDAPGDPPEFKAAYFAQTLVVALAETVLHDEIPSNGKFHIASTSLSGRYVIQFQGDTLRLANLTGAALKRMGAHAEISGTPDYAVTQQWSLSVFQHPDHFDGFVYMSRHVNNQKAVVLFDRAHGKIHMQAATELSRFSGFAQAAKRLGIVGM